MLSFFPSALLQCVFQPAGAPRGEEQFEPVDPGGSRGHQRALLGQVYAIATEHDLMGLVKHFSLAHDIKEGKAAGDIDVAIGKVDAIP